MKHIDIVLPCYNPELGWEYTVVDKYSKLKELCKDLQFSLYIVDDGSSKGFTKTAKEYIIKKLPETHILSYPNNKGKGYALRTAVSYCASEYILYTDYDFPYTIESMYNIIQYLQKGTDVVIAERGEDYYKILSFTRSILSKITKALNKYIFKMKHIDTQAGLKGFNRKGRDLFLSTQINSYLFDWEFVYLCEKQLSLEIKNVHVYLRDNIHFSAIRFANYWRELKCLIKTSYIINTA